MFQGSIVALVTPMTPAGEIDEKSLRTLIEKHIEAGTNAIVVNGMTGEAATLSESESKKIIEIALKISNNRIPIIAGTGTNSTIETIRRTEEALQLGVDACLVVTPAYNKPPQEGLYQHFKTIAEKVPIPIILYNAPTRASCDLLPETVERLSHFPNIIAIKEDSVQRGKELKALCGDRLDLFSGDDQSALAFILQGGKGVISVTANVAPKAMKEMCQAALARDFELAGTLNNRLMPLHKALFLEPNPIPVKWAVAQLGWAPATIRLPLIPLSEKYYEAVRDAMKTGGVL